LIGDRSTGIYSYVNYTTFIHKVPSLESANDTDVIQITIVKERRGKKIKIGKQ
jgi:hypothetical protein